MRITILAIGAALLVAGAAQASPELAKAKNCMTCHAIDKKIVGPAYKDIATKRAAERGPRQHWPARSRMAARMNGAWCRCRPTM